MQITLFNDTQEDWVLHSGSIWGTNGENRIPVREKAVFEVPENHDVLLKVWGGGVVLVQTHRVQSCHEGCDLCAVLEDLS